MSKSDSFFDTEYMLEGYDFSTVSFMDMLCRFDQGVLMTDDQGILVFYNAVQAMIDKLDPSDVLGKKITDVYTYNNDSSTCMRVLKHGRPIINYALSYNSKNANVGNTIHSVFPLHKGKKIIGTICFVKDYNMLERSIPSFLVPRNNEEFAEDTQFTFASIIGSEPAFINAVKTAKMAGNSPSPVMLYGETGTGKELFAQAIHNFYYANRERYVDINCAAIPENLIEGLLFGTVKGAYTGALDRAGLFERANGGTIFLDEIDSMPLQLQSKLLRVLQEKRFRRLGSPDNISLNVKVISSLNRSPRELVQSGEFRMDLFYRLAVIYIKIPPLRERLLDIEELGRHFLQKYNRILGRKIANIAPEVIDFFWHYRWPGNVRELEHVIESAVNMTPENETRLKLEHCYFADLFEKEAASSVPLAPLDEAFSTGDTPPGGPADTARHPVKRHPQYPSRDMHPAALNLADTKAEVEKDSILQALQAAHGNISKASKLLGISRQLLGYKLKKYNLRSYIPDLKSI